MLVADWPGLSLLGPPWGSVFFFFLELPASVCECQSGRPCCFRWHKEVKKAYLLKERWTGQPQRTRAPERLGGAASSWWSWIWGQIVVHAPGSCKITPFPWRDVSNPFWLESVLNGILFLTSPVIWVSGQGCECGELGYEGESVIGLFMEKPLWEFSGPCCFSSRFTGILKWGLYCRRSWYLPISHSFCIFRVTSWWCSRTGNGWSSATPLSFSMTCLGPFGLCKEENSFGRPTLSSCSECIKQRRTADLEGQQSWVTHTGPENSFLQT